MVRCVAQKEDEGEVRQAARTRLALAEYSHVRSMVMGSLTNKAVRRLEGRTLMQLQTPEHQPRCQS